MNIFEQRHNRTGLRGPVQRFRCNTTELPGFQRIESAYYDETGRLQEERHQFGEGAVVSRTFSYEQSLLIEEDTYSGDRLAKRIIHTYDGATPTASRSYVVNANVLEERDLCTYHPARPAGTVISVRYGDRSAAKRSFRVSTSSFCLALKGVVAEQILISTSGRVLSKFLLDSHGLVRGLGLGAYDEDGRIVSERFLTGSSDFSDILTTPSGMQEIANVAYEYRAYGRLRTATLTQEGAISLKTTEYDEYGNPLLETVKDSDEVMRSEGRFQTTHFAYKYDNCNNWIERAITSSDAASTSGAITSIRELHYYPT
jgi:hypothetical protein